MAGTAPLDPTLDQMAHAAAGRSAAAGKEAAGVAATSDGDAHARLRTLAERFRSKFEGENQVATERTAQELAERIEKAAAMAAAARGADDRGATRLRVQAGGLREYAALLARFPPPPPPRADASKAWLQLAQANQADAVGGRGLSLDWAAADAVARAAVAGTKRDFAGMAAGAPPARPPSYGGPAPKKRGAAMVEAATQPHLTAKAKERQRQRQQQPGGGAGAQVCEVCHETKRRCVKAAGFSGRVFEAVCPSCFDELRELPGAPAAAPPRLGSLAGGAGACEMCGTRPGFHELRDAVWAEAGGAAVKVCGPCMGKNPGLQPQVHKQPQSRYGQLPLVPTARGDDDGGAAPAAPPAAAPRASARGGAARARGAGTAANPITLSDDEGEPAGAGAAAGRPPAAAAAAAAAPPAAAARARGARGARGRSTADRFAGLRCVFPAPGAPGAVELSPADLARLDPDEFLNDTAIDFYLRVVEERYCRGGGGGAARPRLHFFNSFLYKKLTERPAAGARAGRGRGGAAAGAPDLGGAAAAHARVRTWTRDADVFAADYVLVPVHDALHWSLVIACHPGVAAEDAAPRGGGGGDEPEVAADPRCAPVRPAPLLLHLDSIAAGGGHSTHDVCGVVRRYLAAEWEAKAGADPASVPGRWAAAHPGRARAFGAAEMPALRGRAPKQDNHCDCGLFVCAFAEAFAARPPPALNPAALQELAKRRAADGVDLWEGDAAACTPGLLTPRWFPPASASALRWALADRVLRLMAADAGLLAPDGAGGEAWVVEGLPPERQALLREVMAARDGLARRRREQDYVEPLEYLPQARADKEALLAAIAARATSARAARRPATRRGGGGAAAAAGADGDVVPLDGAAAGGSPGTRAERAATFAAAAERRAALARAEPALDLFGFGGPQPAGQHTRFADSDGDGCGAAGAPAPPAADSGCDPDFLVGIEAPSSSGDDGGGRPGRRGTSAFRQAPVPQFQRRGARRAAVVEDSDSDSGGAPEAQPGAEAREQPSLLPGLRHELAGTGALDTPPRATPPELEAEEEEEQQQQQQEAPAIPDTEPEDEGEEEQGDQQQEGEALAAGGGDPWSFADSLQAPLEGGQVGDVEWFKKLQDKNKSKAAQQRAAAASAGVKKKPPKKRPSGGSGSGNGSAKRPAGKGPQTEHARQTTSITQNLFAVLRKATIADCGGALE